MPWNTPATVTAGVTAMAASDFNNHATDLSYLAARSQYHTCYTSASADYALATNAGWADVDATNMIAPITPGIANARIRITFQFNLSALTNGATLNFDVTDGTTRSQNNAIGVLIAGVGVMTVFAYFNNVSASAKTYKLQYQLLTAASTATIKRSNFPIVIDAWEM